MSEVIVETVTQQVVQVRNQPGPQGPPGPADDGDVAAAVTSGPLTTAALNSTYAPVAVLGGSLCAIYGDSIANNGEGYAYWIGALSRQRLTFPSSDYIVSFPGRTSAQLVPDISLITGLARKPRYCFISAGSNDAGGGVGGASFISNIATMCDALREAGIVPVLISVPPRTGVFGAISEYNLRLRRFAEENHIPVIDSFGIYVNPATELFASGFDSGDGIHPSAAGTKALAQRVVEEIGGLTPRPVDVWTLASGANIHTAAAFSVDSNADGLANGLSATPSTGFTFSRVSDSSGFWWQRMNLAGATGDKQILTVALARGVGSTTLAAAATAGATALSLVGSVSVPGVYKITASNGRYEYVRASAISGAGPFTLTLSAESPLRNAFSAGATVTPAYAVGDRLAVSVRFRNGQNSAKFVVEATCYTSGYGAVTRNIPMTSPNSINGFTRQVEDAVGYGEFVVPANTEIIQMRMVASGTTDGTYDLALPLVVNLTALGLA